MKKILRKKEAAERLGGGVSTFHEKFVKTGRIKLVYLGKRSVGFLESEVDRLVDELVAESEAHPDRRALAPTPKPRTRRKEKKAGGASAPDEGVQ